VAKLVPARGKGKGAVAAMPDFMARLKKNYVRPRLDSAPILAEMREDRY
jgi:hypothetical protein